MARRVKRSRRIKTCRDGDADEEMRVARVRRIEPPEPQRTRARARNRHDNAARRGGGGQGGRSRTRACAARR